MLLTEGLKAGDLILQRDIDQVAFDGAFPLASPPRRPTAVERNDDEALIGEPLLQNAAARRRIDRERMWAAIVLGTGTLGFWGWLIAYVILKSKTS